MTIHNEKLLEERFFVEQGGVWTIYKLKKPLLTFYPRKAI